MRISPISPVNYTGIKIDAKENNEVQYLYNKVLDVVNEEKVGGVFGVKDITLNTDKPTVIDKLKQFGIKFIKTDK